MSKKDNIPRGVQLEFEDIDYWHKLPRNQYVTLKDGSKISVYEWAKKFMHENYGNNFDRHNPDSNILQTEEQKKAARRNNNNTNRDALLVSRKMGALNALFEIEKTAYEGEEESWTKVFKKGTYNEALKVLVEECCNDAGLEYNKRNISMVLKFYFRIAKFIKMVRKDQRNNKDKK